MTRTQSYEHEHFFIFCSQQFAQLLQNTDYRIVFGAFIHSTSSYLLQRDIVNRRCHIPQSLRRVTELRWRKDEARTLLILVPSIDRLT